MKLCKITTLYSTYWQKFYARQPGLTQAPYTAQKAALDHDGFGWADFWFQALTPLGYEVLEISANVKPLQTAWADEQGVPVSRTHWLPEIVFEQVRQFQPIVLFLENFATFSATWIQELKQACPDLRLVISWCSVPYEDADIFKAHDLVLSCIPELVEQFRHLGHHSEHLNHAFEPDILTRFPSIAEPEIDFSFVGQIVRGNRYHFKREQILEQLASQIPIQIYSPSAEISWKQKSKAVAARVLYLIVQASKQSGLPIHWFAKFPQLAQLAALPECPPDPVNSRLQPWMRPAVFGLEMFRTLQNSKLTWNCHIDVSPRSASNMRLFEATGVGTCLVTDWKENLHTLFAPDTEVVTYRSTEECIEKVQWLLAHPDQRHAIAQAGQARTLRDHTFAQRAVQLDHLITKALQRP
jgi:spore maturation protein CgeB